MTDSIGNELVERGKLWEAVNAYLHMTRGLNFLAIRCHTCVMIMSSRFPWCLQMTSQSSKVSAVIETSIAFCPLYTLVNFIHFTKLEGTFMQVKSVIGQFVYHKLTIPFNVE